MTSQILYRIIDANANRCREALRVIEDFARFHQEDARIAAALKKERHIITRNCDALLRKNMIGLRARAVETDPGRKSTSREERARETWFDIVISNFRRAEESLRVLEEMSKLVDAQASVQFKRSRFRIYSLEKDCVISMGCYDERD